MIFIALILDILADHRLVAMFADRTCEETVCPEFASPQLFLDLGAPPENLAGRHALQHPDDLRHTVGRHGLNQKMYVILVRAYLQNASIEFGMDYAACGLIFEKSSFPAIRKRTVRIVSNRVKPRALRFAA